MRIALIDYAVNPTNAHGIIDLEILRHLSDEHDFTVFAADFENPNPDRIHYVRVPMIKMPMFMMYVWFHLITPLLVTGYRLRHRTSFDLVQINDVDSLTGTVSHNHFCNRAYLRQHWHATRPQGLRRWARYVDHRLRSLTEPLVFRRVKHIIVPSQGVADEMYRMFSADIHRKVRVIHNPIDVARLRRPPDFDRAAQRRVLGFAPDDLVMVFVALGHFERKGLPLVLEAMQRLNTPPELKLLVVGGTDGIIADYTARCQRDGLMEQVRFVGLHRDIRPFLWLSDLFIFPSYYETFSMVSFEAAAAGLPLLVSRLHGVSELIEDSCNGWLVERSADAIAQRLAHVLANRDELPKMGAYAARSVQPYDSKHFVEAWRQFYAEYSA